MTTFTITSGNRTVIGDSNNGKNWSSRLFINVSGELVAGRASAEHKSLKGAQKWAREILAR